MSLQKLEQEVWESQQKVTILRELKKKIESGATELKLAIHGVPTRNIERTIKKLQGVTDQLGIEARVYKEDDPDSRFCTIMTAVFEVEITNDIKNKVGELLTT